MDDQLESYKRREADRTGANALLCLYPFLLLMSQDHFFAAETTIPSVKLFIVIAFAVSIPAAFVGLWRSNWYQQPIDLSGLLADAPPESTAVQTGPDHNEG